MSFLNQSFSSFTSSFPFMIFMKLITPCVINFITQYICACMHTYPKVNPNNIYQVGFRVLSNYKSFQLC